MKSCYDPVSTANFAYFSFLKIRYFNSNFDILPHLLSIIFVALSILLNFCDISFCHIKKSKSNINLLFSIYIEFPVNSY